MRRHFLPKKNTGKFLVPQRLLALGQPAFSPLYEYTKYWLA